MELAVIAVVYGLALLVWSAGRFVEGAAAAARHFEMPPLLIGMVIVGFGASAPELAVSVLAALEGAPGMALGNAIGSNITNIALILGATALIRPIAVQSQVLRKELPILAGATAVLAVQLVDGVVSRVDAAVLLCLFAGLMLWMIREGLRQQQNDMLAGALAVKMSGENMPIGRALFWLAAGLLLLIASSRRLVWGAVSIAQGLGVSDLLIGLTVVAVGTSLPELASSIIAARKGEHDIALGNVLGSNLFNTFAAVGLAGVISPLGVGPEVLRRDMGTLVGLTASIFAMGYGFHGPGRINRVEGAILVGCYIGYLAYLASGMR